LTGVDAPGAALVIRVKDGKETLFLAPMEGGEGIWLDIRPHAPKKAKPAAETAPGRRAREGAAEFQAIAEKLASKLGFADIRETPELDEVLDSVKGDGPFYTMLAPEEYEATSRDEAESYERAQAADPYDGRPSRTVQFKNKLAESHGVEVKDLTRILDQLRRVKTPEEVEAIRVASKMAAAGHLAAMRATRPGVKEWQIGAEATAVFYRMGAPAISYFPIVGTGRNAIILHYTDTGATVAKDDVILMDYAPEWRFYASDVTRSWPASGKFSERGRQIYAAVLKAQEAAIAAVKPGVAFGVVNKAAMDSLQADGFPQMKYMPHGLSHAIGMSTHDVGGIGKLEPGVVFTIEPGIYDRESGIGVRIEDVIAVTETGADVLSRDCPKTLDEIESVVGKRLRQ
jgi:Xaa-Pro aminopeptidase